MTAIAATQNNSFDKTGRVIAALQNNSGQECVS